MESEPSNVIIEYLHENLDFVSDLISSSSMTDEGIAPTLNKAIELRDSLRYFLSTTIKEDLNLLRNDGLYIPLLTRSINLGSYTDLFDRNKGILHGKIDLINSYLDELNNIYKEANTYVSLYKNIYQRNNKIISDAISELKEKIQSVEAAKLAIESNATDKFFVELSEKYEEEYELNNEHFRNTLFITVCCTILSIAYAFNIPIVDINWAVFISVKFLILAVGITLCTLFLRRAAHAKKLHEKAYQTHVEINAYPLFIRSLEKSDQQEITKELALRYFGNNIDQTQNDKIGDLVQDQLSAGTELVRASAEMVKAKNGKGDAE
ncbi:hypothetical protein F7P75_10625 [Acinetobacter gandensis]|uniref:Uncharacterized protein n=1 Tax=Acinetobacter gandensis TaxID=1443941 RepID=A0A1A7R9I4_9GAMM|nr:hypothetical protein [Acinetobacter gandensis]KAB0625353.1 hypothetical protein F7P75_10625 [Acinetobacter gandensis]OBX27387.1 hypothetical protein A9J31_10790 [Acinetobacter gandensis]